MITHYDTKVIYCKANFYSGGGNGYKTVITLSLLHRGQRQIHKRCVFIKQALFWTALFNLSQPFIGFKGVKYL